VGLSLLSVYALGVDVWLRFLFLRAAERNVARGLSWVDVSWWSRGGGGAFFLAAPRFVRVFARSSCTELIRTGEPRRTFSRWTEIISRSAAGAAPPPARPCRLTPPNLTCSERAAYGESDREQSNTQIARWKRRLNNVMIPKLLFTRWNFGAGCANI